MDNLDENVQVAADAVETEGNKAAAALGKFKDVETLLKAYSSLEAEFTRRSQRLKELENENKAVAAPDAEKAPLSQTDDERIATALADEKIRDAVIGDYLKGIAEKTVPLAQGGGAVAAPKNTPQTVRQAGKLAQQFLNK